MAAAVRVKTQTYAGPETNILAAMGTDPIKQSSNRTPNQQATVKEEPPFLLNGTQRGQIYFPIFVLNLFQVLPLFAFFYWNWQPHLLNRFIFVIIPTPFLRFRKKKQRRKLLESIWSLMGLLMLSPKVVYRHFSASSLSVFLFLENSISLSMHSNFDTFSILHFFYWVEVLVALYEQNDKPSSALE